MTAKELLQFMPKLLNGKKTRKVKATYGFDFTGEEPGRYTLTIDHGHCSFEEGFPQHPSVSISVPSEVWMGIACDRISPMKALRDGQMKVQGNKLHLLFFNRYFSGDPESKNIPEGTYAETENEAELRRGIWHRPRRVLGIQASPRREKGATEVIYSNLAEGMREAGAQVDTIYLADQKIEFCLGCFACWKKHLGKCVHNDDISRILPTIPQYDLLVLATPLYTDGMPGSLKTFCDRLIPLGHPHIYLKDGRCRHPARFPRLPNLVLASVCGFYEKKNFKPLVQQVRAIGANAHSPLVASVLRPAAMALLNDLDLAAKDDVKAALRQAGKEIIERGKVSRRTRRQVEQPLMKRSIFLAGSKDWWVDQQDE